MAAVLKPTPLPTQDHAHHAHDHDGHGHEHGHEPHRHAHAPHKSERVGETLARPALPRLSLIALSGGQRLALILPAIAILWLLAIWAMTDV
jgi:hypothetical protein